MSIVCHPYAVRKLECFHDGRIPTSEMDRALAIDAAFRDAHPEWYEMNENARHARETRQWMRDLILSLRAVGVVPGQLSERNIKSIRAVREMFRTHHRLALAEAANKKEIVV